MVYNELEGDDLVKKNSKKVTVSKNGRHKRQEASPRISKLGMELRKLREEYIASGGKLLNRKELEREIAERRGLR